MISRNFDVFNPPEVECVRVGNRGMFLPEMEDGWSDGMKLAWLGAIIEAKTGLRVRVAQYKRGLRQFSIQIGHASLGTRSYGDAWLTITYAGIGAEEKQRQYNEIIDDWVRLNGYGFHQGHSLLGPGERR